MLKDILKKYIDQYFKAWEIEMGGYPTICVDEEEISALCFGKINTNGFMQWNYKENPNRIDYSEIEEQYHKKIPEELKEFYSSFFFLELCGFYKNDLLCFDSIDENSDIKSWILYDLQQTGGTLIFIGNHGKLDLPIAVEVETGHIVIYDWEKKKTWLLAESLEEIFLNLLPRKGKDREN